MKIVDDPKNKYRFIIIDDETGEILDDAQGYGYKSIKNASKVMWYKFKNGKQKIDNDKKEALEFFKNNRQIEKEIDEMIESNIKQFAIGEYTDDDIIDFVEKEYSIKMKKSYLKYL